MTKNPHWIDVTRPCGCLAVGAQAEVFLLNACRCVRNASRDKNKPANSGSSLARILYPSSGTVAKSLARLADDNYVAEANCTLVQAARARGMIQTRSTETNWTKMEKVN